MDRLDRELPVVTREQFEQQSLWGGDVSLSPDPGRYYSVADRRCTKVHKDFNYVLALEDTFVTAAALIKENTAIKHNRERLRSL